MKKLKLIAKILAILFIAPYLLVVVYSVVPPISMPVIGKAVSFQNPSWRWRSIENISPNLARAIISAEDGKFCSHNGVDWQSLDKVIKKAKKRGKLSRGASTINMQIAKNLFYWPLPGLMRKPLEIPMAMWIDLIWSKQRTIEVYMNIAQMGDDIYGAEAASQHYFGKSAKNLSRAESARLASILPNPIKRNPAKPSKYVRKYSGSIKARAAVSAEYTDCIK
jgi:monofunctional biosynthetic peptidoglycan transglycosylase